LNARALRDTIEGSSIAWGSALKIPSDAKALPMGRRRSGGRWIPVIAFSWHEGDSARDREVAWEMLACSSEREALKLASELAQRFRGTETRY
jgi:hypothetical protein